MSIGATEQTSTRAYYLMLSEDLGDQVPEKPSSVYAETRLPAPGMSNPSLSAGTLLGKATNETGIAEKIAELLTDAGQITAVRICPINEEERFIRCTGGIYLNRRPMDTQKLERIIALVAEKKPGLQILR